MKGHNAKLATTERLSATTVNAGITATTNTLTPKATKDFSNPDYRKQQWCISRVTSRGRTPICSGQNCSRQFQREDLSIQVSARWIPPHGTTDGKKFTVDRNCHFCLRWACLQNTPANSNLQTPPSTIKIDERVKRSLSPQDYKTIFSEHLPVEW